MSNPHDDGSSTPGSASAHSGTSGAGQSRKPRIEVLRPAPSAIPASDFAQTSNKSGINAAGAAPLEASLTRPSWDALDQRQQADTLPARRRRRLFSSRTVLLMLMAAVAIAGLLLYTYISSKRDADEYADERTKSSSVDAARAENLQTDSDLAENREPTEPSAATRIEELVPEPATKAPSAPKQAAAPETREVAVAETLEEPVIADRVVSGNDGGAPPAVRAFYSALSAGDGASAAQLVVPEKRQRGPLSAGALSRYYSSFRRPLRVRSVARLDARTTRVAYDYVLADGRLCRGEAAVDVVQRDGRSLVSRIRTRGPC